MLEDKDVVEQLEECDDFVRSELDRDFADFDYPEWNAMIKRMFPLSDDGEKEVESDVGKGKGRVAGSSKVGPPAVTTRTSSRAKPATQTAGRVTVKPVPKERMTRSQSLTDIRTGEKPAPVLKPEVRALLPIVDVSAKTSSSFASKSAFSAQQRASTVSSAPRRGVHDVSSGRRSVW